MVYITTAGSEEKIPVPVDKDNLLPLQILERYFPGAAGLMYFEEDGTEKRAVSFDESMTKLVPPAQGWNNKLFYIVHPQVFSRPGTSFDRSIDAHPISPYLEDLNDKQMKRIERLSKYMFYSILTKTEAGSFENVSIIRSCVTVANKEYALMAAHCLPTDVPEQFQFQIFNQNAEPHLVQIKYINRKLDFVVLKTVDKEFDTFPNGLAYPEMGMKYTVLGYHGYNYQTSYCLSTFFGRIRNNRHSPYLEFVLGSPGTTRGCSGAGAFTHYALIGIIVARRISPQNVYSSNGSLSDHVAEACIELAEPSYSHIVPSSTIFALFEQYSNLLR